jgi:phage terminase large subunit
LVLIAVTPNNEYYQVSEVYKTGLGITDMVALAKQKMQSYKIEQVFCDPSGKGHIVEFCNAGIPAVPANNNIEIGIGLVYDLISSRRYKIFRGDNKHTIDEFDTYHYPSEKEIKEDTDLEDNVPVKQNDHAMDAIRYAISGTYTGDHTKKARIISQNTEHKLTIEERMERIRQRA